VENLAGDKKCDVQILGELEKAGINVIQHNKALDNEVTASITGQLGRFTFVRGWYYWIVSGRMPIDAARKMYADPNGRKDVRVAGHCGCPPPEEWTNWFDPKSHRRILTMKQKAELEEYANSDSESMNEIAKASLKEYDFAEDPSLVGEGFVDTYHIDTQEGLNLFTATIRAYQLF
jgi:hypothetical protein